MAEKKLKDFLSIKKNYLLNFLGEEEEWLKFTPGERLEETSKLWQFYIAMGGNLDPEPDPQSPFYFLYEEELTEK